MALNKNKKVWFIRHGESEANAGLATSEPGLISLTERGYEQSKMLTQLIIDEPNLVITTKFVRTQQTAEATIKKFENVNTMVLGLHEFDFLSPMRCVDTTVEDRKPMVYEYWKSCQADIAHGADAETFKNFYERVVAAIVEIEKLDYNFILVFAHGHVMRAIWQYFLTGVAEADHATMKFFRDKVTKLPVPNCTIFKANFNHPNWNIESPTFEPDHFPYRD